MSPTNAGAAAPGPPARPGFLRSLPWPDIGSSAAVVTVGFTQVLFALVLENLDYFPREPWFHLGVLLWAGALPFVLLLALDLGIARLSRRGPAFWGWRALLATVLFASLLRQAQIYYPRPFNAVLASLPPRPLLYALLALVFLLCIRFRASVNRYVAVLGILAVLLASSYTRRCGLMGPLWTSSWTPAKAAQAQWKGDPVYILILDELSSDLLMKDGRIDAASFPNFAALADASAWFPRATTNHFFTKEALPCMLTGKLAPKRSDAKLFDFLPPDCKVVIRTWFPPTYGWLRSHSRPGQTFLLQGVQEEPLKAFFQIPSALGDLLTLTPFTRSPFDMAPATRILPPLLRKQKRPRDVDEEVREFLASVNAREAEGTLTLWHAPLPHFPFHFNADGTRHDEASTEFLHPEEAKARNFAPDYDPQRVLVNYRRQIQFTDLILGRFLSRLREEGLYDRSTLIVTSDHGLRTFGVVEPLDYPRSISGGVGRVPLFLRAPGLIPGPRPVDYQHVDFTPTVLDLLKIPVSDAGWEGISAFAADRPSRAPRLHDGAGRPYVFDPEKDLWKPDFRP